MAKKMSKKKKAIIKILTLCGVYISFYIGAGFATMQEVIQYEVSYGSLFFVVILVAVAIYIYTNLSFAENGNRLGLKHGGAIYEVYCSVFGKKFGKYASIFFDYFAAFFCYMSFIVKCGGMNSTVIQQWGLPFWVGAVVLTVLVVVTSLAGREGILNALGILGPLIIILILLVSIITTITGLPELSANMADIDAGKYADTMAQIGGGNPVKAGASYGGFVILWFAVIQTEIGATTRIKQVHAGMLMSALFIIGASGLCCTALIGHIQDTAAADIPALVLAASISPVLGQIFAVIICAAIYTSAVPLLWTGVVKIAPEGSPRYKIVTIIGGAIGCIVACFVPFKGLVNILYGINGYLGFILVFFMIVYDIKTRMSRRVHDKDTVEEAEEAAEAAAAK